MNRLDELKNERNKLDKIIRRLDLEEMITNTAIFCISCHPPDKSTLDSGYLEFNKPEEVLELKEAILEILKHE